VTLEDAHTLSVTPSRVTLARRRRGFTISGLAKAVGVSAKTVTRWESGEREPEPETLERLAAELMMPESFFVGPDVEEVPEEAVSFRALSKMTAKQKDMSLASGTVAVELCGWMLERFKLPEPSLPTLEGWAPEEAAAAVRERWGLGIAPISNMLDVLEAHGIRVFSLADDCTSVDAFSFRFEGQPIVLLNTNKTAERRRFDAAHELAHLVLHCGDEVPHGREAEAEAQKFASAFLMPAQSVLGAGLAGATVPRILQAKQRWGVAAIALTHRLRDLGLLSEWGYRDACVKLSKAGFRSGEPTGAMAPETSQVWMKIVRQLATAKVRPVALAAELNLDLDELNAHVFGLLPKVILGSGGGPSVRPNLRVVRDQPR
jgi:Zn-dependent peptidase ImmA (M78 family)/transcriptional regulator with XRE-family HTH domain